MSLMQHTVTNAAPKILLLTYQLEGDNDAYQANYVAKKISMDVCELA